jgi:hypothetical protein
MMQIQRFVRFLINAYTTDHVGYKAGPGFHARYFQLKGYDKEKRNAAVAKRRGAYTAYVHCSVLVFID